MPTEPLKVYVMATSRDFEKLWKRYQDEFQGLTFADAMSKKKSTTTVERMLFESNLRQSIEQSLRTEDKLSDMERQDYINQINDLKGYVKRLLDMIDTLKQTLDTVPAIGATRNW